MDTPLTTEDRLVLLCARVELEPWRAEELARLIHGSVDWDQVLVRVTRHGISTLLHRHLRGHRIPASVAGALEASTRAARLQVLRQRAEALRLLDALAGANVEAIPLKGLALRERYYPDPTLRPSGDLDLLLRPGDAIRAEAILQGLGYRPNESELPASWYQLNRFHHVVPYRLPGRDVQIELHAGLFEPAAGITVDMDGLWLRSCGGEIAGRPVRWLSPEDLLLHLAVHACASSRFQTGLRHLVDLGEVVRRHCSDLDWAIVQAQATAWRALDYVYLSLRTASELLGSEDLSAASKSLRPAGFDEWLVEAACHRVLELAPREARPAVSDNLGQLLRSASGREQLSWLRQSLFPSPSRVAFLYQIPPGSWRAWPCYLLRPFQLLARYAPLIAGLAARRPGAVAAAGAKAEQLRLDEWLGKEDERGTDQKARAT